MKDKAINNFATIAFVLFLIIGAGYSLYTVIWQGPSQSAREVNKNLILACEKNKARSQVFQDFALEAAAARRRSSETLYDAGKKIAAENEVATAKKYEGFASRWDRLTVHNCLAEYPEP